MFEIVSVAFFAVTIVTAYCVFLSVRKKRVRVLAMREKKQREFADAANGEYLNWSKVKRVFFKAQEFGLTKERQDAYPTMDKCLPEYAVQDTPGGYAADAVFPNRNWSEEDNKNFVENRDLIDKINELFVEKRLAESKDLFDKHGLTHAQRLAVIRNEDANLINAGAGSGKTRTIVSKVEYLIKRRLAKPAEILVIVYNKKIQREIAEKMKAIESDVVVSTFHALGLGIVKEVEGSPPTLSELATDDKKLSRFLSETMRRILKDLSLLNTQIDLFSRYRFHDNPEEGIKTKDEYFRAIRYVGMDSLDGTVLKSHQEVEIANWLILNGIKWEYEKSYPHTDGKRQHRPDFYLPDYDLWIEHFGVDEHGNTAPWVDRLRYQQEMQWKRDEHRANQTKLVETYSYESRKDGGLPKALDDKLAEYGIKKRPMSDDDIDHLIAKSFKPASGFIKLVRQFLMRYRENKFTMQSLKIRADHDRNRAFLALFDVFRECYEKKLENDDEIDFTDMIVRGLKYLQEEKYQSPFKYILVDEYQDITKVRLEFLLALQQQVEDARLFCVGDDWQSIYRFNGADVSLITHFGNYVDVLKRTDLDKTFRYSQKLNEFSVMFITQNPTQLTKSVESIIESDEQARPVRVVYHPIDEQRIKLHKIIDTIASHSSSTDATCLVLGRYRDDKPRDWHELKQQADSSGVAIEYSTIHQAKGREAEWVVVVENKSDLNGYGFPSKIENDPVLRMLLDQKEKFANAEERRLFYVAVTRARRGVFLLVPAGEASDFIREIDPNAETGIKDEFTQNKYAPFVHAERDTAARILICPECSGQTIQKKSNSDGQFFYACSNYPSCMGRLRSCEVCDSAIDLKGCASGTYTCECGQEFTICPRCGDGVLVQRDGQRGPFLGCSQFSETECKYTKDTP